MLEANSAFALEESEVVGKFIREMEDTEFGLPEAHLALHLVLPGEWLVETADDKSYVPPYVWQMITIPIKHNESDSQTKRILSPKRKGKMPCLVRN